MHLEPNHCACGANDATPAFGLADWNFGNCDARGTMLRCNRCASLFPDCFPDAASLGNAYSNYYTTPRARRGLRRLTGAMLEALSGAMRDCHLPDTAKSLLDFGCGSGNYLQRMSARRPDLVCAGTDIARPGDGPLPFDWIASEKLATTSQRFDWITMNHVLEHVPDPAATLQQARSLLAPGGALWIATPNAGSLLFDLLQGRARDADFPRHRQIFSETALRQLLGNAGLAPRFLAPPRINMLLNLRSGLANRHRPPQLPNDAAPASLSSIASATLSALTTGNRAPELVVIARPFATP